MRRVTIRGLLAHKLRLVLTALAIVLGVTFVTGTLVLGDTLTNTVNNLIGTAYQHISFEIRGMAAFTSNTPAAVNGTVNRKAVPESIAASMRKLPGVAYVFGSVGGYAGFVAPNGAAIGKGKAAGFDLDPNRELASYRVVLGHAPSTPHQVVMDEATAEKYHFKVGGSVRMLLFSGSQTFMISGVVAFAGGANLDGETLAGFDLPTAQKLFDSERRYNTISVLAKPGADNVQLQRAIAKLLPPGVQVVSGRAIANELTSANDNALSLLSTILLIFAFISLFVGAFTIFNTFTITVGQRTRELALLRVVGASRKQVFLSLLAEAALTGLAASLIGLGVGVLAAFGLRALLGGFGITLPSGPLVFEARTAVVALAVGIGVTVISAILPAQRAIRIPPVAALVEHTGERTRAPSRKRITAGAAIGTAGIVIVIAGLTGPAAQLVGIGAVPLFIAAAMLVPLIARPLSGMIGRPLVRLAGTPARLGRENSMRNPRRTAQTAGALMIGIALVCTIAVFGSSLGASFKHTIQAAVSADYVITSTGGFSETVPTIVSHLPDVTATNTIYKGQFDVKGSVSTLDGASPSELAQTVNVHITAGSGPQAMAAGELLIETATATSDHLHVGSAVPVTFAQTGPTTMRVGGIYTDNGTFDSYLTGSTFFLAHYHDPLPTLVMIKTATGATNLEHTLKRALAAYPNLTIQTRSQFESSQINRVNQILDLVYVLLALAIIVALIGIVNTLMLSVFERTREIGLLRAVGMKRRQVRAMIRSESIIIATLGAVNGIVIGTWLGTALASSLRNSGVNTISIPIENLIAFLILSALLGSAAATWPARRAASLDILTAIATE
ncbi:MAG: ABC transporter permease [Solirubrobacteraceae bacterium]